MEKIIPISFNYSLMEKKNIEFTVPGKPRGKERPRTVRFGNRITTYTPKNTVEYENLIRDRYTKYIGNTKFDDAIEANITGIFPIPKSTSKKNRMEMLNGNIKYTKKIDCDNLAKVILDALNKLAYDDDSQVCKLIVTKEYGNNPMVKINLKEL